jgi:threonine dehydratase
MPTDAPVLKRNATLGYGAEIIPCDRFKDDVDEVIQINKDKTGLTFISPFDHCDIIAGGGTVAMEMWEEQQFDHVVIGIGGGGIAAGTSIVSKHIRPEC